jgi:hypothetical protein
MKRNCRKIALIMAKTIDNNYFQENRVMLVDTNVEKPPNCFLAED